MFLSTSRPLFVTALIFTSMLSGCGSSPVANTAGGQLPEVRSRFPFSQKEPEVYQAEAVVTSGGIEQRWFIARNGEKSRVDLFYGTPRARIEIGGATLLTILPGQKIYAERQLSSDPSPREGDRLSRQFFAGADYRSYTELAREDGLRVFSAKPNDISTDEIKVWVDEATGLIVRQQFRSPNGQDLTIFELRGLRTEAEDALFTVPAGFKKVSFDELERIANK